MKTKWLIWLTALLLSLSSCSDIIEPSLEKDKIVIVTPQDTVFGVYNLNFTWDILENATQYQVKIIELDSMGKLQYDVNVDTLVKDNSFRHTFAPGYFQVHIRGKNNSSYTDWVMKRIRIKPVGLSEQTLVLKSPNNKKVYNITDQLPLGFALEWDKIPEKRIKYKVQFDSSGDFRTIKNFPIGSPTDESSILLNITKDATYYWRVKALKMDDNGNYTDSTDWSDRYYFTYDVTAPQKVDNLTPVKGSTQDKKGTLQWSSTQKNVIYIVNIKYGTVADPAHETYTLDYAYDNSNTTNTTKEVFWSVDVKDKAGNITKGDTWSFTTE
jgi:hypothetical protein